MGVPNYSQLKTTGDPMKSMKYQYHFPMNSSWFQRLDRHPTFKNLRLPHRSAGAPGPPPCRRRWLRAPHGWPRCPGVVGSGGWDGKMVGK